MAFPPVNFRAGEDAGVNTSLKPSSMATLEDPGMVGGWWGQVEDSFAARAAVDVIPHKCTR